MAKKQKSKSNSFEDRLVDLYDIDEPTILTLYGRSGSGKTTISGTLPKPIFFIDVKDKGTLSARNKLRVKRGDIQVFSLKSFDDIYEAYDYLSENTDKFKTVVIDHLTALQELGNEKVKAEEGKDQMSQRMFGNVANYMKEVINLYKELNEEGILPCFIVQDRLESGDGEGEDQLMPEVGPGLMPSVSKYLCAVSRVIGHTYLYEHSEKEGMKVKKEIQYRLRLGPNPYYITKFTRPQGSECPAYLVHDLNSPTTIWEDIETILAGEWNNKPAKSGKKSSKKSGKKKK